jgi:hypothetical protein
MVTIYYNLIFFVEHDGSWKMMHYYAAKMYSPYLVSPYINSFKSLVVHAMNDYLEDFGPARIKVNVHLWGYLSPLYTFDTDFDLVKLQFDFSLKRSENEFINSLKTQQWKFSRSQWLVFMKMLDVRVQKARRRTSAF